MSDLVFSSPAKREKFLKSIASIQAKIAAKKAAKQLDLFAPPADVNEVAQVVTTPVASGQLVGLPLRPSLLYPLVVQITRPDGFWACARSHDVVLHRNAYRG